MRILALLGLLLLLAPAARAQLPVDLELRRLTDCYVQKLVPDWREVRVVILDTRDTLWVGSARWDLYDRTATLSYNLARLGDEEPWRVALHEVAHLVLAPLYYLAAAYVPERVALNTASERAVGDIVSWPVWRGLCGGGR